MPKFFLVYILQKVKIRLDWIVGLPGILRFSRMCTSVDRSITGVSPRYLSCYKQTGAFNIRPCHSSHVLFSVH